MLVIVALFAAILPHSLAAQSASDGTRRGAAKTDNAAERKLLPDLLAARDKFADHHEPERYDREMSLAFRAYGIDLDHDDPKVSGSKLAGRPLAPEIAPAIDARRRADHAAPILPFWRRLAEIAKGEAIRLKPGDADAHSCLGRALSEQGKPDPAIAEFREAIRLAPRDEQIHFDFGCELHLMGNLDEAIAEFREAIRIDSADATYHVELGGALYKQKKLDAAIAAYREAIRLKPDVAKAKRLDPGVDKNP